MKTRAIHETHAPFTKGTTTGPQETRLEIGITVRSMGPQSTRELLGDAVDMAEKLELDSVWVTDHIAIPPDDAEGSEGRYLDPLTTLAWLAGRTSNIGLGTGVLVLPYRRPLPTAKAVATVQELSGGRLRLGVGIGWMKSDFAAVGADRRQRVRDSEEVLRTLRDCFGAEGDVTEAGGQKFLFRPNPPRPPIFVGGAAPHALLRAARLADGWMPMGGDPESLGPAIRELHRHAADAGRPTPEVVMMGGLPIQDTAAATQRVRDFAAIGVTRFVMGVRYDELDGFRAQAEALARVRVAFASERG